jgi:hypothetical protein
MLQKHNIPMPMCNKRTGCQIAEVKCLDADSFTICVDVFCYISLFTGAGSSVIVSVQMVWWGIGGNQLELTHSYL